MPCQKLRSYSDVSTIKLSIHNCVCLLSHPCHSTWALILFLNIICLGAIFVNFTKHHSTLLTRVQQHLDDIGIWSVICKKKWYFSLYVGYKNWSIAILHCAPKLVITVIFWCHIRRIILVSHFLWDSYLGEISARNYLHTVCYMCLKDICFCRTRLSEHKQRW